MATSPFFYAFFNHSRKFEHTMTILCRFQKTTLFVVDDEGMHFMQLENSGSGKYLNDVTIAPSAFSSFKCHSVVSTGLDLTSVMRVFNGNVSVTSMSMTSPDVVEFETKTKHGTRIVRIDTLLVDSFNVLPINTDNCLWSCDINTEWMRTVMSDLHRMHVKSVLMTINDDKLLRIQGDNVTHETVVQVANINERVAVSTNCGVFAYAVRYLDKLTDHVHFKLLRGLSKSTDQCIMHFTNSDNDVKFTFCLVSEIKQ